MSVSYRKTILRIAGFILSILLTFTSIMLMRKVELLAGFILLVISVILFMLSVRAIEQNPLTDEELATIKPYLFPVLFLIAALVLMGLLIFNMTEYPRTTQLNNLATAEWLLSMLSLSIGVLWLARWKPAHPRVILEWIKANPVEFSLATAIFLAGFTFRLVALNAHPYPWSGDEASIGMEARRMLIGENTDWFNTGWSGQPNVSFLPTLFNMLIFGETFFAIKMTSVVAGSLAIIALYMLAREWFGREIALIASGFLVAYPFHLHFSRIGVNNVVDSLMAPLVLWLIFRAVRTRSLPTYLLAGIATGFTFYTYVGTRLVLAMGIGSFVYIMIRQKGYLKNNLLPLGTYLAALLVTLTPIVVFFIKQPTLFMTRIGQEGIFLNGWLPRQMEITGQNTWQILFDQFSKTILVFVSQNATYFLNFDRPYLTVLGAIFFVIGLAIAFRHLFEPRYFILLAWFWSVLFLGGFLTLNPPANTRLLMTIPATALFIALGVWQIAKVLVHLKFKQSWVYSLVTALVVILAIQNLSFYFGVYREKFFNQDANGELAMEAGLQLQQLGDKYEYYLFGIPRVFAKFPTTEFLTPGVEKYDLVAESIPELALTPGRGAFIVAIPDNQDLLEQVKKQYPGGKWEIIPRKVRDEVLYYAYILTPDQINYP
jgi:4-amino-4-deoxy-L-arabinose transferase-like glycosyltransferase